MSQKFGLSSKADAVAYLEHPILGPRLRECTELMLKLSDRPIDQILGYPFNGCPEPSLVASKSSKSL